MRKIAVAIVAVLLLVVALAIAVVPGLAERAMNRTSGASWPVAKAAQALHRRLTVIDLHGDTLLWKRDLRDAADRGHIDLPRLEAGHVALQVFSSVTKTPRGQNYDANGADTDNITALVIAQGQPPRTWTSLLERSLWHAEKLRAAAAGSDGRLRLIRDPADLRALLLARAGGQRVTGALLSVEGAHDLEGDLANLDRLHAAGFRMVGLVHFFDNDIGGSMHGLAKGGLTPLGRRLVPMLEARGMIVDLAHSSAATFADALAIARRPVVVSHGGVKATCDTPRNLTDAQLRALAANGGVIGIGYWDAAVCEPTPQAVARAIVHAIDIAGIDHVGLGSDFDGAVTTGWDTANLAVVTDALLGAGLSDVAIAKVMGGNVQRLLTAGLAPLPPAR